MKEQGIVEHIEGNKAIIAFERTSACQKCHACQVGEGQTMLIELENTLHAQEGDVVTMELQAKKIFQASAWVYIFPLAMLFGGIFLGYAIAPMLQWNQEITAAVGALLCVAASYLVLRCMDPWFQRKKGYTPKMCEIISIKKEKE